MTGEIWVLFLLSVKHFICDFPLQAFPWQYKNKGTYGHPGGLVHASIHAIGTLICLAPLVGSISVIFAVGDAVAHYHIDWAKMNIGRVYGLKPDNSELFWILLGVDQLMHYLTYIVIAVLAV